MDGSWKVYANDQRWTGGPTHQIRAILGNTDRTAVGYRLPVLELLRTTDEHKAVGHLGPDLLGPDWNPERALANLLQDPTRELGEALLDQRNLAGIGNVYKSELCFLLGATPWLPIGALPADRTAHLPALAKKLLEANRDRPIRSTTGRRGQDLFVYGRAPRPACAAAPPSGSPTRATAPANAPPTGAPTARPARPREPHAVRPIDAPSETLVRSLHGRQRVRPHRTHRVRHRRRERHRPCVRRPARRGGRHRALRGPRREGPARDGDAHQGRRAAPRTRTRWTSPTASSSGGPSPPATAWTSWPRSPESCTAARSWRRGTKTWTAS